MVVSVTAVAILGIIATALMVVGMLALVFITLRDEHHAPNTVTEAAADVAETATEEVESTADDVADAVGDSDDADAGTDAEGSDAEVSDAGTEPDQPAETDDGVEPSATDTDASGGP